MQKLAIVIGLVSIALYGCSKSEDASSTTPTADAAPKAKEVAWNDVKDILATNCLPCHGKGGKAGVDVTDPKALLGSGEHGVEITPGDENSLLIQYVTGAKKPQMPMGKTPLGQADIDKLKTWVKAGAKS